MHIIRVLATLAALSALNVPAMAAEQAPAGTGLADQPAVPDGDLGCVVRMMILGYGNTKVISNPKASDDERKKAQADDIAVNRNIAFYLGRLSVRMPNLPLVPTLEALIAKTLAEPAEQSSREVLICEEFQKRTKVETLKAIRGR